MAFNPGFFGDQRQVSGRIAAKYSGKAEAEVNEWINSLIGHHMQTGMQAVEKELKSGHILVKICQKIAEGTPNLPEACRDIKLIIKEGTAPFHQMENIDLFLNFAECYGVPKSSLFQTVDLYEGRNMAAVLTCLLLLGSEAQRHGFRGPVCGPKPVESRKGKGQFTLEQLKQSESLIPVQSGTNKFASQQGMSAFGAMRHGGDTHAEPSRESNAFLNLQTGTNKFATQSGMFIGGFRPLFDRGIPDNDKASEAFLSLQTGTNKFASQKGMSSIGGFRDINFKGDAAAGGSEALIPLQSGTNKFANQNGMHIGSRRDILIGGGEASDVSRDSQAILSGQYGTNKFATQTGMAIGGFRDIVGGKLGDQLHDISQVSQAIIPIMSGTNKFASQKGMALGSFRDVADSKIANHHAQATEGIMTLQAGFNHGANQRGMVFGGTRHGADMKIMPIWSDF